MEEVGGGVGYRQSIYENHQYFIWCNLLVAACEPQPFVIIAGLKINVLYWNQ